MRDKRARQPLTENWRHNHMKNMTLVIINNMTIPQLQLQTCYTTEVEITVGHQTISDHLACLSEQKPKFASV